MHTCIDSLRRRFPFISDDQCKHNKLLADVLTPCEQLTYGESYDLLRIIFGRIPDHFRPLIANKKFVNHLKSLKADGY